MRGAPLSPEDATRLWMGSRAHPLAITAVLELGGPLPRRELAERIEARLLVHPRFSSAIVDGGLFAPPRWDPRPVDLRWHLEERTCARDAHALERVATECARAPFDPARPRWRAWLVHCESGSTAIVLRVHHAIADGHALLGVLLGVTDEGLALPPPAAPEPGPAAWPSLADAQARARSLARLVARRRDALSHGAPWPGALRLAWSEPLALGAVKSAARRLGGHVTDLLLAAMAPALLPLLPRGAHPVHALVPVALPSADGSVGNHFVSVFVSLPVGEPSLRLRVDRVRRAMDDARADAGLALSRGLVRVAGILGSRIEHAGIAVLARRASTVVSSVVGPPVPLHVCGLEVTRIVASVPAPGSIPLALAAVGYADRLQLCLGASHRLGEPGTVLRAVHAELDRACGGGNG